MIEGKIPPQAIDLEEAVLGAIMLEKKAFTTISAVLKSSYFYVPANQNVYRAYEQLFEKGEPIDILTVTQQLRKTKLLDQTGGTFYIAGLTNRIASAANIESHAAIIVEKYQLRSLIALGTAIIEKGFSEDTQANELMGYVSQHIIGLSVSKKREIILGEAIQKSFKRMNETANSDSNIIGIPYGLVELDSVTSGKRKGHFILVGARPSMGKTAFLTTIAHHSGVILDNPIVIFSLETTVEDLADRILSNDSQLDIKRIEHGNEIANDRLHKSIARLENKNIYIDTDKDVTVFDIKAKLYMYKMKYDIKEAYIDFLQLIRASSKKGTRDEAVGEISRTLKICAQDLDIAIIALSQLTREVEKRTDKKPQLSDLRESGSLEADADEILFLWRPYYYKLQDNGMYYEPTYAEINVAKHKTAQTGWLPAKFIGNTVTFTDQPQETYEGLKPINPTEPRETPNWGFTDH